MSPDIDRDPRYRVPTGFHAFDQDYNGKFSRQIVVRHPEERAGDFEVPGTDKTVADFNPDYPEDAPVVQLVYEYVLDDEAPEWRSNPISDLWDIVEANDLQIYSYPGPRIKSVPSILPRTIETHRQLVCYQSARLMHLSVTMDQSNSFAEQLMWTNYQQRLDGEITLSSILKENQYQMKENVGLCTYCGKESKTTFDHVIPMSKGGPNDMDNMVPVCQSCNSSKSNKNVIDWHREHDIPIDRVVLGKYLKMRWAQFEEDHKLDDPLPDFLQDRWDGVEITRNISQTLYTDARLHETH